MNTVEEFPRTCGSLFNGSVKPLFGQGKRMPLEAILNRSRPTASEDHASMDGLLAGLVERRITVNGQDVAIPFGISRYLTARSLKQLARVYQGEIVFVTAEDGRFRRVEDRECVDIEETMIVRTRSPQAITARRFDAD